MTDFSFDPYVSTNVTSVFPQRAHLRGQLIGLLRDNRKRVLMGAFLQPNVRGHRADEMKDATRRAASEAPGGPRG